VHAVLAISGGARLHERHRELTIHPVIGFG
jgi:hypothetical protein